MKPNRLNSVDVAFIDKTNVFVEVNSPTWRSPVKISIEELLKEAKTAHANNGEKYDISKHIDENSIIIDPHTLKIKVNDSILNSSNVKHEYLENEDNIDIHKPPKDALDVSRLHLMSDSHHLYVWTGERWKRILLSDWED